MGNNRGLPEGLARTMTEEERAEELPCFVRHPDAGGSCGREAEMMVYGLAFCSVHGAEAEVGALRELFEDASDFLQRLDNPHYPIPNAAAEHAVQQAVANLGAGRWPSDIEEDELVRIAYPVIEQQVDSEIREFDYRNTRGVPTPGDDYLDARALLHKLMRQTYEEGVVWLVEQLEYEREHVSAQAAFALEDYNRRVGVPGRPA